MLQRLLCGISLCAVIAAGAKAAPVTAAAEPVDSTVQIPAFLSKDPDLKLNTTPLMLADDAESFDRRSENFWYQSYFSIWMPSIKGTVGKNETESDIDVSFSDIMDKATFSFGLNLEAGKGPWSVIVFGLYLHLKDDLTTRNGFDGDLKGDFALLDVAGAYQVWETGLGSGKLALDALLGLRWTYLKAEIDINTGPFAGLNRSRDKNIFDPYVGARARWDIDRNWDIQLLGTAGGFGVGSDFAASGLLQAEYKFSKKWSAILGYRAIYYNYDDNFEWKVTMHGPVIGISYAF